MITINKEKVKKFTLNDFIAKAKQKDQSKKEFKEIEINDGILVAKKMDDAQILDLMDSIDEDSSITDNIGVFKELIYHSIPELQKEELRDQFEVVEPYDVVTKVFEIGEVINIGNKLMNIYGLDNLGEDLKN